MFDMKNFIFNLQYFADIVNLTEGNDTLNNGRSEKIIYALGGNDTIENNGGGYMIILHLRQYSAVTETT